MHVHELADADPTCGGKAAGLARLIAAGLPVPPGFVLDDGAFRAAVGDLAVTDPDAAGHVFEAAAARLQTSELPRELVTEVLERARELGTRVVVRSSATIEDGEAGAAAGVFSSQRAVPAEDVWAAIRAVWTSALTPLAAAYARRRTQAIAIGVIVQRHVEGELVTVYTRPPGAPEGDELLVQRGGTLARFPRQALPHDIAAQHAVLQALRAEHAIDAASGADVELVQAESEHGDVTVIETHVVQARPIVHPRPRALVPPPPIVLAPLEDGRTWSWDITHNPDPLSPAQAGLVERVERAGLGGHALRVCAGYLYTSPRPGAPPPPVVTTAGELRACAAALEARCDALLAAAPASLSDAVERYVAFYAIWAGELSPLVAAARRAADGSSERSHRPSSVEATLAAAARGELAIAEVERRLGDLAPTWDVAVAPFGDRPGVLAAAIEYARSAIDTDHANLADHTSGERVAAPADRADRDHLVAEPAKRDHPADRADRDHLAALAADLAERDDLLFARAQRMVRRALLARAAEQGLASDDIFWLPLEDVLAAEPIDREAAQRRASAARSAADRAAQWQMPIIVGGTAATPARTAELRGVGSGPRVIGRVVRFASLAAAAFVGAGDIAVVRAVTPALAVFLGRCTALVSETGGLLDHGAALARELDIPCVVGCFGAWTRLTDGMLVEVDGDAGTITIVEGYSSSS